MRSLSSSLALGLILLTSPAWSSSEPLAVLEISESELQGWKDFRQGAPFLRGQTAVDSLALVKALALEARAAGLETQPQVVVSLGRLRGKWALQTLRREVNESVTVSEAEVDAELEASPRSSRPRRVRLRNLFRRFTPANRESLAATMESYRQRVLAGEDFGELALSVSESETRWRRGLLGNVRPGMLRSDVDAVARSLEKGEVSEVLVSDDGLTLLYCEDILPAVVVPAEEQRRRARRRVEQRRYEERWQSLREDLVREAALQITPRSEEGAGFRVTAGGAELADSELAVIVGDIGETSDPRELRRWRKRIEQYLIGQVAYRRLMSPSRPSPPTSLAWPELQILASAALTQRVEARYVEPSEPEVEAAFGSAPERFPRPEMLHLSVIRLPRRAESLREDTQRAAELLAQIRAGRDFSAVAREVSDHPSSVRGGALRAIARQRLSARLGLDMTRAVRTLSEGEISELVTIDDALWIVRLDRVEPERQATLDEARSAVRRTLVRERREQLEAEEAAKILAALEIRLIKE